MTKKLNRLKNFFYLLIKDSFIADDLKIATKVIKSKNLTMGKKTILFEKYFAKKLNKKYAL